MVIAKVDEEGAGVELAEDVLDQVWLRAIVEAFVADRAWGEVRMDTADVGIL